MNPTVIVQEFAIVIAAKNNSPTILNIDFLKYSGIVPADWELARPPVYTNRVAQITFTNGVSIVAETNRVIFMEAIEGKASGDVAIPSIVRKYVEVLPNVEYQAIGLNPRGYASFDNQEAVRKYLAETLFSPGSWQEVGEEPVRATVNLTYTLERGPLNLSINEAALRLKDENTIPVVLFTGNFSYDLVSDSGEERLNRLYQVLENWQADLEIYQDIVSTKFFASEVQNTAENSDLFAMSVSSAA